MGSVGARCPRSGSSGADPCFGLQFRRRIEPSSLRTGRAYGALRASSNRDLGRGLLWACRGVSALSGAGCTRSPGFDPPVPYPESRLPGVFVVLPRLIFLPAKWVFFCVCEMKSSNPFIPTTARASSGPFMDIPSRRRGVGSPSAHLDFIDETPRASPNRLPKSCRMVLPSNPCSPGSRAI